MKFTIIFIIQVITCLMLMSFMEQSLVQADNKMTTTTAPPRRGQTTTTTSRPYGGGGRQTTTAAAKYNCRRNSDGLFPSSSSCTDYFVCSSGVSYSFPCPNGYLFDTSKKACALPSTSNVGNCAAFQSKDDQDSIDIN